MLQALLGFDMDILRQTGQKEQAGYRLAGWLFSAVCLTMVLADAYFGFIFHGGWAGILLAGHFLGYIHFAVYRLAMITLTTRPLGKENDEQAIGFRQKVQIWLRPDAAALFRLVFISLIALAVSFPGAALLHHLKVVTIQESQHANLLAQLDLDPGNRLLNPDARFPFQVLKELWSSASFKLAVIFWMIWIFFPMLLLTWLRHAPGMEYTRKLAEMHRKMASQNYQQTVLEVQQELDKRFPGRFRLQDLQIWEDPPFNTRLKNPRQARFGSNEEFHQFLRTIPS
jgi:hypothetical protein